MTGDRGCGRSHPIAAGLSAAPEIGTGVPLRHNNPGGTVHARARHGRSHRRPSAGEATRPEQRKPIVTELALADALGRLVNLIEELKADADLRVEITTDETSLVKLAFSGTPDVGFAMRREVGTFQLR